MGHPAWGEFIGRGLRITWARTHSSGLIAWLRRADECVRRYVILVIYPISTGGAIMGEWRVLS